MNRAALGALRARWDRVRKAWQPGTGAELLAHANEMLDLLDALLEDGTPPLVCVRCNATITADAGMVNYGVYQRGGHFFSGIAHSGNCPVPLEAWVA